MAAIDYGNDYATISAAGRLTLDLSNTRITGPMVPVIRAIRAWLQGPLFGALEKTWTPMQIAAMGARLRVVAEQIEHVMRADVTFTIGTSKAYVARGQFTINGSSPVVVTVSPEQITLQSLSK